MLSPKDFGSIADGASHPLSETYKKLRDAQVDFPAAQSIDDEKDWCAIQQAVNSALADNPGQAAGENWSNGGLYLSPGVYVVNREIVVTAYNFRVQGEKAGAPELVNNPTKIVWMGEGGTIDAPKYIFRFYTIDPATGNPPEGMQPQPRGVRVDVRGVAFEAISNIPQQKPGYVSAMFLGFGGFCRVIECNFGSVYDGICIGGAQLFVNIERNQFYGCYRDCFSQFAIKGNFTTCLWIRNNEFGYYGRYAIAINSRGVELQHIIESNDFEGQVDNSFYFRNPQHFFQGVVADVLLHQLNGVFLSNRFEGGLYRHNVHVASDVQSTFAFNAFSEPSDGAAVATSSIGDGKGSTEFQTYLAGNGYSDLTDERNYTFAEGSVTNGGMSFYSNIVHKVFMFKYGAAALSNQTDFNCALQSNTRIFSVPVVAGTIDCDLAAKVEESGYPRALMVTMNAQRAMLYQALETEADTFNVGIGPEAFKNYGGGRGVLAIGCVQLKPVSGAHNATLLYTDRADGKLKAVAPDGKVTSLN